MAVAIVDMLVIVVMYCMRDVIIVVRCYCCY